MAKARKPSPRPSPASGKGRRKLKVFRTPIGFHDAYVAAPSQKAALEAWGIDVNLFARGAAEEVTEPELMKEPLENPGAVVKRLRGTEKEQIAALGKAERLRGPSPRSPSASRGEGGGTKGGSRIKSGMTKKKPKPKPSRAAVADAEEALEALGKAQRTDLADLDKKEKELARERRELERRQERERRKAEKALEEARERYMRAMEEWKAEA